MNILIIAIVIIFIYFIYIKRGENNHRSEENCYKRYRRYLERWQEHIEMYKTIRSKETVVFTKTQNRILKAYKEDWASAIRMENKYIRLKEKYRYARNKEIKEIYEDWYAYTLNLHSIWIDDMDDDIDSRMSRIASLNECKTINKEIEKRFDEKLATKNK